MICSRLSIRRSSKIEDVQIEEAVDAVILVVGVVLTMRRKRVY